MAYASEYEGTLQREGQFGISGIAEHAAVLCVGNKLMLDDGIGPAVYEEIVAHYDLPESVQFLDLGCMTLDQIPLVESCDFIITVDAVDGTDEAPGTVFRFAPEDMARHNGANASLHDLKLVDLFDAAALLGYTAEGVCFGMQVENMVPSEYTVGLTPACFEALPLLVESVVAELYRHGIVLTERA